MLAKKLCKELENNFNGKQLIKKFENSYRTMVLNLCDFLFKNCAKENITFDNICGSLYSVFAKSNCFKNLSKGLFIASIYYKFLDEFCDKDKKFELFINGQKRNNIDEIEEEISSSDLIKIFNEIYSAKSRQIFVSMPFGKSKCNNMFHAVKEVVTEISRENEINFPSPIRIDSLDKSHSYPIDDSIIESIENAGYIIASLNYQRPNVYHEIGYAMGFISAKGMEKNLLLVMEKQEKQEKQAEDEYRVHFNIQGYHQLLYTEIDEFKQKIKKKLLIHYGLEND